MSRSAVIASLCLPLAAAAQTAEESPLKLGGYIQGQYVRNQASEDTVKADGSSANLDRFEVRRARLKATYENGPADAMLHVDFGTTKVRLLDAEVGGQFAIGGTRVRAFLGQFRVPFGYELLESMSRHPFPERSLWAERLFPGVRDVGARVDVKAPDDALTLQIAVVNGNTISDSILPGEDPDAAKDVVGRLGTKLGPVRAGVSGYFGEGFIANTPDESSADFTRWAGGADVVVDVKDPLGKLVLLGEAVFAQNLDRKKTSTLPKAGGDDIRSFGWYGGFQQSLGEVFSLGARYQQFDPDDDADDELTYVTLVGHAEPTKDLRFTVAYEIRNEAGTEVDDDQLWVRAQTKF
jgi:hypothetical protein